MRPILLAVLLAGIALSLFTVSCRRKPPSTPLPPQRKSIPKHEAPHPPRQNPEGAVRPHEPRKPRRTAVRPSVPPKIAVIIDDLGYSDEQARPFIQLPFPIALSVLPQLRYSGRVSQEAAKAGKPVLLHLPLEAPKAYNLFLGPGAFMLNMKDEDLKKTFEADLLTVPDAHGLNNHMGSKGSQDPRLTRIIAEEAAAHHLFIIDSLTSPDSLLYEQARKLGVPAAKREIFLDNTVTESAIQAEFAELIAAAKEKGTAIAIGHPHPETLKVLAEALPKLQSEKIEIVPVTALLTP